MSTIIAFIGPSISAAKSQAILPGLEVRGPAGQGDVYLAAKQRPWAIVLIDGVFDQRLAVTHKEILWAMSEGVHVFGASSMGALRAAELHPLGMVGVGRVFEDYRDEVIVGDDEVALTHGPAEVGHAPFTVAMVDVRATVEAARQAAVLDAPQAKRAVQVAREIFYPERSWPELYLRLAPVLGPDVTSALRDFVAKNEVSQKREDARAVLGHVQSLRASPRAPKQVEWTFEPTSAWQQIRRRADERGGIDSTGTTLRLVLEEARVHPHAERLVAQAWMRAMSAAPSETRKPTYDEAAYASDCFRRERSLHSPEDFQGFLAEQGITDVMGYFEAQARLTRVQARARADLDAALLAELQAEGLYAQLCARAARKQACVAELKGDQQDDTEDLALIGWLLHRMGYSRVPSDLDTVCARLGFRDKAALRAAAERERAFVLNPDAAPSTTERG